MAARASHFPPFGLPNRRVRVGALLHPRHEPSRLSFHLLHDRADPSCHPSATASPALAFSGFAPSRRRRGRPPLRLLPLRPDVFPLATLLVRLARGKAWWTRAPKSTRAGKEEEWGGGEWG